MSQEEHRGLSGRIEISYNWDETSSGHVENTHSIELLTQNGKIYLKEFHSHQNFYKSKESSESTAIYEIDPTNIIALIKEHGKRTNVDI